MLFRISLAKSGHRAEIMVALCRLQKWTPLNPVQLNLSCDLNRVTSFPRAGRPKPQRQDRLIGGRGLYMNYSNIFRESSFYPETSILLHIIRIIHMTFRIMPEYDRKGRASAGAGSQATVIRLPTDKELSRLHLSEV